MSQPHETTEELLRRASTHDANATEQLMARHRARLGRMVAIHLDRRLRARVDPSDIVQNALTEASVRLPDYLKERTISFYPWLRQIAWQELIHAYRRHLKAKRRSVLNEEDFPLPDGSADALVVSLVARQTDPGDRVMREEQKQRVRAALEDLPKHDTQILSLRYLEHLSLREIADVLKIGGTAARMRHLRALERLSVALTGFDPR